MSFAAPFDRERGFTLVELLVVIIILGVLCGTAATAYSAMIGGSPRLETWALTGAAARNQQATIDMRTLYETLKDAQTKAREAALRERGIDPDADPDSDSDSDGVIRIKSEPVTVPALLGPEQAPGMCTIGPRSIRGTDITCTRN